MKGIIISVNKQYKDSAFPFLFSDPDAFRGLYGALEVVDPSAPITIDAFAGALFVERIDGLSFETGGKASALIER
jgi:hypothetical protein